MIEQIKSTVDRAAPTLLQDALGALSIAVMLIVALHIPGFA